MIAKKELRAVTSLFHQGSPDSKEERGVVLVTVALTLSCGGGSEGGSGSRTLIQNKGSDTLVNVAQAWAEAYGVARPEVAVAVSLERLERLCQSPPQRIGCSATLSPLDEIAAYLVGQLVDIALFHWLRGLTRGKHLWLRNNGSTLVSQFVDTFAVITITHFYAKGLPIDGVQALWPQLWVAPLEGLLLRGGLLHARAVAERWGTEHHEFVVSPERFDDLRSFVDALRRDGDRIDPRLGMGPGVRRPPVHHRVVDPVLHERSAVRRARRASTGSRRRSRPPSPVPRSSRSSPTSWASTRSGSSK